MNDEIQTSPQELFMLIGEREFIKFKQGLKIQELYKQIEEMSKVIEELRDGKLDKSDNNKSV